MKNSVSEIANPILLSTLKADRVDTIRARVPDHVSPNACCKKGISLLGHALHVGALSIARYLLHVGADPDLPDLTDATPTDRCPREYREAFLQLVNEHYERLGLPPESDSSHTGESETIAPHHEDNLDREQRASTIATGIPAANEASIFEQELLDAVRANLKAPLASGSDPAREHKQTDDGKHSLPSNAPIHDDEAIYDEGEEDGDDEFNLWGQDDEVAFDVPVRQTSDAVLVASNQRVMAAFGSYDPRPAGDTHPSSSSNATEWSNFDFDFDLDGEPVPTPLPEVTPYSPQKTERREHVRNDVQPLPTTLNTHAPARIQARTPLSSKRHIQQRRRAEHTSLALAEAEAVREPSVISAANFSTNGNQYSLDSPVSPIAQPSAPEEPTTTANTTPRADAFDSSNEQARSNSKSTGDTPTNEVNVVLTDDERAFVEKICASFARSEKTTSIRGAELLVAHYFRPEAYNAVMSRIFETLRKRGRTIGR